MIVLDTNILSELMRPKPNLQVIEWMNTQSSSELFISAITMAEILHGVARLPDKKRKSNLRNRVLEMLRIDFADNILPFGAEAAVEYANLVASSEAVGRCVGIADTQIAAICREHDARLATRNVRDFESFDITLINPWDL